MGKLEERRLYSTLVEQLWKVSSWIRWLSSCFGFALSDSTRAQWSNPFRFSYPTCFRKIGCTPSRHGLGLCDKHVTAAPWTSPLHTCQEPFVAHPAHHGLDAENGLLLQSPPSLP